MTENQEKIVALYVRVSTGYQVDKDSLPFQKKELKAYCEHVLHIDKKRIAVSYTHLTLPTILRV